MSKVDDAFALLGAGRFEDAERLLAGADDPRALHALAIARLATGKVEDARALVTRALEGSPDAADAHATLGVVLAELGEHAAALRAAERAVELDPANAGVHAQLGNVHARAGRAAEAERAYARAVAIEPSLASARVSLGTYALGRGELDAAFAHFLAAFDADPTQAPARVGLGLVFMRQRKLAEAARTFEQVLADDPKSEAALLNLAQAVLHMGDVERATELARRALELHPSSASAHASLASALLASGELEEATRTYERAAELAPNNVQLATIAAVMLAHTGPSTGACAVLERLAERFPNAHEVHDALAQAYLLEGRITKAREAAKRALAIEDRLDVRSFLLGLLHTELGQTDEALFEAARDWGLRAQAKNPRLPPARVSRDPDRRLRVGYVSADFRVHHVGLVMEAVLPFHDPKEVEVFCYQNNGFEDEQTAVLKRTSSTWRNTSGLSDEAFCDLVREDAIDVLVDLGGHTSNNRLEAFARKPAPVQVTWLGYWATTGLGAIDWVLCDARTLPEGEEGAFVERPWRIPGCYVCIPKPRIPITVSTLPARRAGYVTFACYNNLALMNDAVARAWAEILQRVPRSRLVVRQTLLGEDPDAHLARFAELGVEPSRVRVFRPQRRFDILRAYQEVDVALDPFPYSCGATTAEAIFMSVPVVAMRGPRYVSRITESMLETIGAPFLARTPEEYVRLASELALDLDRLSSERVTLRARLLDSPLGDARGFTKRLEQAFRGMWRAT